MIDKSLDHFKEADDGDENLWGLGKCYSLSARVHQQQDQEENSKAFDDYMRAFDIFKDIHHYRGAYLCL